MGQQVSQTHTGRGDKGHSLDFLINIYMFLLQLSFYLWGSEALSRLQEIVERRELGVN